MMDWWGTLPAVFIQSKTIKNYNSCHLCYPIKKYHLEKMKQKYFFARLVPPMVVQSRHQGSVVHSVGCQQQAFPSLPTSHHHHCPHCHHHHHHSSSSSQSSLLGPSCNTSRVSHPPMSVVSTMYDTIAASTYLCLHSVQ